MEKGFISVQKLERLKDVQTELIVDSPFFFEDLRKEEPTKRFGEWLIKHKVSVGIGSAAFIVAVVSAVKLIG